MMSWRRLVCTCDWLLHTHSFTVLKATLVPPHALHMLLPTCSSSGFHFSQWRCIGFALAALLYLIPLLESSVSPFILYPSTRPPGHCWVTPLLLLTVTTVMPHITEQSMFGFIKVVLMYKQGTEITCPVQTLWRKGTLKSRDWKSCLLRRLNGSWQKMISIGILQKSWNFPRNWKIQAVSNLQQRVLGSEWLFSSLWCIILLNQKSPDACISPQELARLRQEGCLIL